MQGAALNLSRHGWISLALGLVVSALLSSCGGGGGGGGGSTPAPETPTPPVTPPPSTPDLRFVTTNLPDGAAAMPVLPTTPWLFDFDTPMSADSTAAQVELRSALGTEPVTVDMISGALRIRPAQELRLRTDYTLTIKTGSKAANGAILRTDVVRHFRTVLFDGVAKTVAPGNGYLHNFRGQHTLRVGDLNGDGRPDIVQIGGDPATDDETNSFALNIFTQNADHSFTRSQNLIVHEPPQSSYTNEIGEIAIVDLDQDGVPEIVVAILRTASATPQDGLMVFKQDAQGRYAQSGLIPTPFGYKLFVADIDHDGKPDLLTVGKGQPMTVGADRCGMLAVLSRPGSASPQPATVLPCGPSYEAVLGSLERAGQLELVMLDFSSTVPPAAFTSRLHIYTLDAQGRPTVNAGLTAAAAPVCAAMQDCSGLMLMDINGDGLQDLLFRNAYLPERKVVSAVFTRAAGGNFAEYARQDFGASAYAFLPADVDRDGRQDVVVFVRSLDYGGVAVGLSKPTPGIELSHLLQVNVVDAMEQRTVAAVDVDGDGLLDFVMDSYNSGIVVVFQRGR